MPTTVALPTFELAAVGTIPAGAVTFAEPRLAWVEVLVRVRVMKLDARAASPYEAPATRGAGCTVAPKLLAAPATTAVANVVQTRMAMIALANMRLGMAQRNGCIGNPP